MDAIFGKAVVGAPIGLQPLELPRRNLRPAPCLHVPGEGREREGRKREATPDGQVAGVITKGTYIQACLGALQAGRSAYPPPRL